MQPVVTKLGNKNTVSLEDTSQLWCVLESSGSLSRMEALCVCSLRFVIFNSNKYFLDTCLRLTRALFLVLCIPGIHVGVDTVRLYLLVYGAGQQETTIVSILHGSQRFLLRTFPELWTFQIYWQTLLIVGNDRANNTWVIHVCVSQLSIVSKTCKIWQFLFWWWNGGPRRVGHQQIRHI